MISDLIIIVLIEAWLCACIMFRKFQGGNQITVLVIFRFVKSSNNNNNNNNKQTLGLFSISRIEYLSASIEQMQTQNINWFIRPQLIVEIPFSQFDESTTMECLKVSC